VSLVVRTDWRKVAVRARSFFQRGRGGCRERLRVPVRKATERGEVWWRAASERDKAVLSESWR
jgi:hypothetical protein